MLLLLFTIGCRDKATPTSPEAEPDRLKYIPELNLEVLVPLEWECDSPSKEQMEGGILHICVEKDTSRAFRSNYNIASSPAGELSLEDLFNSHEAAMREWEESDGRVDSMEVLSHDTTMIHNERFGVVEFRFIYGTHPLRARQVFTIRSDTYVLVTFMCAESRLSEAEPVFDRVTASLRFTNKGTDAKSIDTLKKRWGNDQIREVVGRAVRAGLQ